MWSRAGRKVGERLAAGAEAAVGAVRGTATAAGSKPQGAARAAAEVVAKAARPALKALSETGAPKAPMTARTTLMTPPSRPPRAELPRAGPPPTSQTPSDRPVGILTAMGQGRSPVSPAQRSRFTAGLEFAAASQARPYSTSVPTPASDSTGPVDRQDAQSAPATLGREPSEPSPAAPPPQESPEAEAFKVRTGPASQTVEKGLRALHYPPEEPGVARFVGAHLKHFEKQGYDTQAQVIAVSRMQIFARRAAQMREAASNLQKQVAFSATPQGAWVYAKAGSALVDELQRLVGGTDWEPGRVSARPSLVLAPARVIIPVMQQEIVKQKTDYTTKVQAHLVSASGTFVGEPQESPASFSRPPGTKLKDVLIEQFKTLQEQSGMIKALGGSHPHITELQKAFEELMRVSWQAQMNSVVAYVGEYREFERTSYASLPYGNEDPSLRVRDVVTGEAVNVPGAQIRIAASSREARQGLEMVNLLGPSFEESLKEAGLNPDADESLTLPIGDDRVFTTDLLGRELELDAEIALKFAVVQEAIQAAGRAIAEMPDGRAIVQRHVFAVIEAEHEELERDLRQ